jgi:hypothetical protein
MRSISCCPSSQRCCKDFRRKLRFIFACCLLKARTIRTLSTSAGVPLVSSASLVARIFLRILRHHHRHGSDHCVSVMTSKFPLQPMQFFFLAHRDVWPFENLRVGEHFWMGVTTDPLGLAASPRSVVRDPQNSAISNQLRFVAENLSLSPLDEAPIRSWLRTQPVHDVHGCRQHSMIGVAVDYDRNQILFTMPYGNEWDVWRSNLPDNQRNKLLFPMVVVSHGCKRRDLRLARLSYALSCSPEAPTPTAPTGEDAQDKVRTEADPAPSHDFNFSVASSIAIGILSSAIIVHVFMTRRPRHSWVLGMNKVKRKQQDGL